MAEFWRVGDIPFAGLSPGLKIWLAGLDPDKHDSFVRVTVKGADGSPTRFDPNLLLDIGTLLTAVSSMRAKGNSIVLDPKLASAGTVKLLRKKWTEGKPDPSGFGLERFTR